MGKVADAEKEQFRIIEIVDLLSLAAVSCASAAERISFVAGHWSRRAVLGVAGASSGEGAPRECSRNRGAARRESHEDEDEQLCR